MPHPDDSSGQSSPSGLVSIEVSGQMAVIRTRPGYANVLAANIDDTRLTNVMGTVATRRHLEAMGYDTATLKPGFDSPGFHNPDGSRMTPKEEKAFRELLKQNGFGEKLEK